MLQAIQTNEIVFGLALVVALLVAVWLFGRGSRGKSRERSHAPDVLDEGAAPAQRNQALIDAPSAVKAASYADTGPDIMGGVGEIFAAAATSEVADAAPPPAPAPAPAAEPIGEADDLRRIKGVGLKLVALLHGFGVTRYSQIAAWTDADIDAMDAKLGTFAGRIRRDSWVEQAKLLAAGDQAGFEAKFGKL